MDAKQRVSTLYVHQCGWKRDITLGEKWAETVTEHPRHGNVTQYRAAQLDIKEHDCETYLRARAHTPRAHEPQRNYGRYVIK